MEISFVVAASENNVIGKNNELPWYLPEDLKFFKKMTSGKPVMMGRKTFESLGKPLPNRLNVIISKHLETAPEGTTLFHSIKDGLDFLKMEKYPEISIIGGGEIFSETIGIADIIYLTRVHTKIDDGEAFFPEINPEAWHIEWEESHQKDERHNFSFTFQKWVRSHRH